MDRFASMGTLVAQAEAKLNSVSTEDCFDKDNAVPKD